MFRHPGGRTVMENLNGKDATAEFVRTGHSQYAQNLMRSMCVGTVSEQAGLKPDSVHHNDPSSPLMVSQGANPTFPFPTASQQRNIPLSGTLATSAASSWSPVAVPHVHVNPARALFPTPRAATTFSDSMGAMLPDLADLRNPFLRQGGVVGSDGQPLQGKDPQHRPDRRHTKSVKPGRTGLPTAHIFTIN